MISLRKRLRSLFEFFLLLILFSGFSPFRYSWGKGAVSEVWPHIAFFSSSWHIHIYTNNNIRLNYGKLKVMRRRLRLDVLSVQRTPIPNPLPTGSNNVKRRFNLMDSRVCLSVLLFHMYQPKSLPLSFDQSVSRSEKARNRTQRSWLISKENCPVRGFLFVIFSSAKGLDYRSRSERTHARRSSQVFRP